MRTASAKDLFAFAMGAAHFRMPVIVERVQMKTIDQIVADVCRHYCRSVEVQPSVPAAKEQ
jgi:hypothetical protein